MARVNNTGGNGFTVDNGTGQQVRTKLNQVISALKSLQSGSGDPTVGLGAYQLHVNEVSNTSQILKIRNKDNDGFVEIGDVAQTNLGMLLKAGGVMTGVLQLPVGSATAPSVHFGQTNTGIFKGASHRVSVTSDGTQVFFADGTGININSSKELRWKDNDNTNYIGFKAPTNITSSVTLTLPATDAPVSGYALISNASGTLSWGVAGGAVGGGTDQVFWENGQAVTTDYSITNGKNAGSFGPITINSGVTVTVGSGETWSVV
jgi:hypothetical protein